MNPVSTFDTSFLLEHSPVPLAVVDTDFRFIAVSQSWKKHYELSSNKALGKSILEIVPHLKHDLWEIYEHCLQGETIIREGYSSDNKEHIQWKILPWNKKDKTFGGVIILREDITEKKRLEDELRLSNEMVKNSFDNASIGMAIVSLSGQFLKVNNQLTKMLGYRQSELEKMFFKDITYPDSLTRDIKNQNAMINGKVDHYNTEKKYITKKKKILHVYVAVSLVKNEKGKPIYFAVQIVDRTEAKKADDATKAAKEELQKIMDESPDIICYMTFNAEVIQINRASISILGYTPHELIGASLIKLIYPPDLEKTTNAAKLIKAGYDLRYLENRYIKKNGEVVTIFWSISVNKKDKTIFVIGQDASEKKAFQQKFNQLNDKLKKRAEELSITYEHLEEFSFVASHDLQEPLRMIKSFMEILYKKYNDVLDDKARSYIHYAIDGAERMQTMLLGLFEYSALGKKEEETTEVDFNLVLKDAINLNKSIIQEKSAIINYPNLPKIKCIKKWSVRLFQELINNALKYQLPSVTPVIEIACREEMNEWYFSVTDNGIGIEEKFASKIFSLFQRLHKRDVYSGSGIGLAVCKRIVENFGGNILVESALSKGSVFYFTISKDL